MYLKTRNVKQYMSIDKSACKKKKKNAHFINSDTVPNRIDP